MRLLLFFLAIPAFSAELELRFNALEHIIADQMFTEDGRHYVRGTRATKCQFAYLEAPHLSSDNGLLKVVAKFSGRSALDLFGRCAGMGDSFDLTITATPIPRQGAIALKDVKVSTTKNSYYIRRVREALSQSIGKDFKIEVRDRAKLLLEQPGRELASFDLGDIKVTPNALVLVVEFRLIVK